VLSHSLHHLGVAFRHLLWPIVLHNKFQMLRSWIFQNLDVSIIRLIGLPHLLIVSIFLNHCMRLNPIQVLLVICVIDLWLECALCKFFFLTFLLLNSRYLFLLWGYGPDWLVLYTTSATSRLTGLLSIFNRLFPHLDKIIVVHIGLLVFLIHFLKVLWLDVAIQISVRFWYKSTLFDPFLCIQLSYSLELLIGLLLAKVHDL